MWDRCGFTPVPPPWGKAGLEWQQGGKAPAVAKLRWPNLVSNLPQQQQKLCRAALLPIIPVGLGRAGLK